MKKLLTIIITALYLGTVLDAKDKIPEQLTTEQKLADFDSLYNQLKDVFPDFGVNKRLHGINWVGNYDTYRNRIKQTQNDKEFLAQIDSIINDLHCAHADLYPTEIYNYFLSSYKLANIIYLGAFKPYVKELKKHNAKQKCSYWQSLYSELHPKSTVGEITKDDVPNIQFEFLKDSSIAIIKVNSFGLEYIKSDKKAILDFYSQLNGYENLIIDIQGNGGGYSAYWQNILVPYLSDRSIKYSLNMTYKDTPEIYKFTGHDKKSTPLDTLKFPALPPEVKTENYAFTTTELEIKHHKKSVDYKGNIYLLADHNVYSSTEAFVHFCKKTGFAKVVGEQTGGDGIGADPFLFTLPNSGIVVRYQGIMGLNIDGSSNDEFGTTPDIKLAGQSKAERSDALKDYIMKVNLASN